MRAVAIPNKEAPASLAARKWWTVEIPPVAIIFIFISLNTWIISRVLGKIATPLNPPPFLGN